MYLVDSHCHLDFEAFDPDRETVLASAASEGVGTIVVPGVRRDTWERLVGLCAGHPGLHYALGLHPLFADVHRPEHLSDLSNQVASLSPVAVGEIGLDYYDKHADRDTQRRLFEGQLDIARQHGLPAILHVRKAHDEVLELLRRHGIQGGIAHAFNGSLQQAHKYVEMGFKLGFGGTLTFERSRKLRELAKHLPLDALVLETDAPDMTVAQHRGERNSPEYIPCVLEAMASVRSETLEEIAVATTRNAATVLGLTIHE